MKVYLGIDEKVLGQVLRKYRVEHGYTQKKLADFLDVDRTTYTKYETVRAPELDVILKLAAFYDVSVDSFLEEFFVESTEGSKYAIASAPDKRELISLTPEEKQLISFYRDSVRKAEIMEKAKDVWLEDVKLFDDNK